MKTLSIFLIAICSLLCSQTVAQDCDLYVPADVGTKWEITSYSAKGKVDGKARYELIDKMVSGNDITFKVKCDVYDKKDKVLMSQEFDAFCKDGLFEFDLSYMLDRMMGEEFKEMDIEMTMDLVNFKMPRFSDSVGTELDDSKMTMTVDMSGMTMKMEMNYTDRKLSAKESITTPAGTYECIVLDQKVSTKISIMDTVMTSKDWYSEGIGMIRNETYNAKGKLIGYSELTSFTR